jgi:hypothetical protein
VNSSKSISFSASVIVAVAAIVFAANAQSPAKQHRMVRVASNTTHAPVIAATAPAPVVVAAKPAPTSTAVPARSEVLITREAYNYPDAGRRDPFVSLMNTEEIRPLIGDLKLVAIAFDATGRNSVAVLRDITTKEQYRVKVGQELGRMRVAVIHEKDVVFGIEEFGYSRQESVAMNDSTKVRTQ